jgi:hypothetical protein
MKRTTLHLLVDVLLALDGLGLVLTGLLIAFVLPPRSRTDTVWSLDRHDWGDVHFWIAMVMLGLAALHVAMNWGWVCSVSVKLLGREGRGPLGWRKHVAGAVTVGVLVVIVLGFLWLAELGKEVGVGGRGDGLGRGWGWRSVE